MTKTSEFNLIGSWRVNLRDFARYQTFSLFPGYIFPKVLNPKSLMKFFFF